ncbi:SPFH domain-containing protein [Haloarcula japonica]|uniref:SPFH domain-containing protein n=1 Tax=Haloarcula japonica TaxID=29282 RepID=UPI0039F6E2AB
MEPISLIHTVASGVIGGTVLVTLASSGYKVIDEEHRGLYERFGKYRDFRKPGLHFKIPVIDRIRSVKVAEQSVNINPSDMITKDNLNAAVDLVVYFQVRDTEDDVKSAAYSADDYERQIVSLARTTARNVIGDMNFEDVNSKRDKLNKKLQSELDDETDKWGIDVVRVELEEISPPDDVQDSMNEILKAENEKDAAQDRAEAKKIEASGEKKAAIQEAEGQRKAQVLKAKGEAQAIEEVADAKAKEIKVTNLALQEYFEGPAKTYKELEVTENSLRQGSKYVIDSETEITPIISEVGGVTPVDDHDIDDEDREFLEEHLEKERDINIDTDIDVDEEKIKEKAQQKIEEAEE